MKGYTASGFEGHLQQSISVAAFCIRIFHQGKGWAATKGRLERYPMMTLPRLTAVDAIVRATVASAR